MSHTIPLTHLGDIPVEAFLRDYWQRKPLLVRQAFPGFESPLTPDELAGLALEEDVESRIVLEQGKTGPWELLTGPFEESIFAKLPDSHWTLLVQAVDQWVPEVELLLDSFRFIPNWRLDDIMVSYAADGGSVGPHFDYYDVFLLQGYGKRRWQLGHQCSANSPRLEGTPLSILKDFEPTQDWELEPGDMLYIPPQLAHHGTGIGDCMTYSIGFRAPSHSEILADFSQEIATRLSEDQRFSDAGLSLSANPGEIPDNAIDQLQAILSRHIQDRTAVGEWFGRYMTSRKYPELDHAAERGHSNEHWLEELDQGARLYRHPAARFAYQARADKTLLFVDGEHYSCSLPLAQLLCLERQISAPQLSALRKTPATTALITQLLDGGSLYLDD